MAETVYRFLYETVKEKFVHLGNKLTQKNHAPRTIIGRDYMSEILTRRNADKNYVLPRIKKVDLGNEEARKRVLSVSYGPFYCGWAGDMLREAKEEAWNHVLRSSEGNEDQTSRLYFDVVSRLEIETRGFYGIALGSRDYLPRERFIWMMIIDGCFLLQVALLVLGGSKQLNKNRSCSFPFIGGERRPGLLEFDKVSMIRRAVSSMFVVGNQIPLLVLRALMRQSFFKNVVNGGIWEQPMDLERWALFELLLAPALLVVEGGGAGGISIPTASLPSFFSRVSRRPWTLISHSRLIMLFIEPFKRKNDPSRKASDLLHGLWLLTTAGLGDHSKDDDVGKDVVYYDGEDDHERSYDAVLPTVRSATELQEVGVVFQYKEGINGIKFKKKMFHALVVLPRIVMDSEKEMFTLFSNLIKYEVIQFGQSRRKVCEYLRLMRGLIRSTEDAKILTAKGIIVVDPNQEDKVPLLFQGLPIPRVTRSHSGTLRSLTDELNNYTNPNVFKRLGDVLNIVVFLTLIQTIYSALSFHLRSQ